MVLSSHRSSKSAAPSLKRSSRFPCSSLQVHEGPAHENKVLTNGFGCWSAWDSGVAFPVGWALLYY